MVINGVSIKWGALFWMVLSFLRVLGIQACAYMQANGEHCTVLLANAMSMMENRWGIRKQITVHRIPNFGPALTTAVCGWSS